MVDFLELESSGLGSSSSDPVMAAINGESVDGERSPLDFSAESSDVSEKIVPMLGPDPLELDKPIGEDEFVRQARRAGTDPLTGSDERAIQTRSGSDPGNNRRRAYNIGTLDGNESYSDSVSRWDRKDFYKFTLEEKGEVDISLSGLRGNADLFLHDSRGKAIEKSRKGGSSSEAISEELEAGDYYVQVRSRNRRVSTNYNLELNFESITSPPPPPDDDDNSELIVEAVDERNEWRGWVSKWDASSGAPSPVNINANTSFELVGQLNLGSNIREIATDGRHGINNADWGLGSIKGYSELPTDNFLVKAYTEVDLEGGKTYKFEAKGDDGYQIWLKNLDTNEWRWVTPENQWQNTINRKEEIDTFSHTIPGDKGGRYYVGFFHYEDVGEAYFGLNWKEVSIPIEDATGSEWNGSFYRFDGSPPSTNFHENEANKLAVLNLGSSSGQSFSGNWGSDSPRPEYIPSDNFAVRSYTHAYFENGKEYEFNVSADDGYQIFAKQHGTNDWFDVTTKNEWSTDAYGGKTISHTWEGPTANYDLHFQYYEIGGDAYFNLDWKEVDDGPGLHSNPTESNPLIGFQSPVRGSGWYLSQSPGGSYSHNGNLHYAIDISISGWADFGEPVYAMRSGQVKRVVDSYPDIADPNQLNLVEIEHDNGYIARYLHLQQYSNSDAGLQVGQKIDAGQMIGRVGNSGWSSGPHLHVDVGYYEGSSFKSKPFEIEGIFSF